MIGLLANRYVWAGAGVLALILAGWAWLAAHDSAQQAIGRAEVQAQWDTDKARIASLAASAAATKLTNEDAARRRNEAIHADLEAKAADAVARADLFARRLRDAQNRIAAGSGAVCQNPSGPPVLPSGEAGGGDRLGRLLADFRRECNDNADALDAVYAGVSPQL